MSKGEASGEEDKPCYTASVHTGMQGGANDEEDKSWPGRDFEVKDYLPDSVYLWACGERGAGEDQGPSASDAVVAWAVLLVQITGYAVVLWAVNRSEHLEGEYSVVSITVAMYLNISIASPDLWASFAMIMANRGCHRAFGFALLASFVMLFASSTKVLFFTSGDNVDLIIGAAAVLFIADMDEKLMVVLKKTNSDWRLFWVVQLVGTSFTLALAGIKWAGDPAATMNKYMQRSETDGHPDHGLKFRAVFGWKFLLFHSPVAVTTLSMVVRAVAKHLVALFENENGSSRDGLNTFICAMKPRCTAYRGLIAALVLLEVGPFLVLVYAASWYNDHVDCCALKAIRFIKAAGPVIVGLVCTFNGRLPTASSEMSAGRLCRGFYKVVFFGLLVLHPMSFFDFPWFGCWSHFTMTVLGYCLTVIVYGFWCHRKWNVFPTSSRIAPKQRPRWQLVFVLAWLLIQCFFWNTQEPLEYWVDEWTLRLLSASLYLAVGISVAFEYVGYPCCVESPGPSPKICSLLLAWSIYRLTSWEILRIPNSAYFGESSRLSGEDAELYLRGVTVQVVLLCLGINAQARTRRNESVQFCLMAIFLFHVVVVWFYTVVSELRHGTFQ